MEVLEEKVSKLEEMMTRLLYIQQKTEMEIHGYSQLRPNRIKRFL